MLILIICTFLFAFFSWRYVELPFRNYNYELQPKSLLHKSRYLIMFIMANIGITIIGFSYLNLTKLQSQIYFSQLPYEHKKVYEFLKNHQEYDMYKSMHDNNECIFWVDAISSSFIKRFEMCASKLKTKATVLLGDSHAMNIYNSLAKTNLTPFLVSISKGGCRPHTSKPNCPYDQFLYFVSEQSHSIHRVIFHQSGSYLLLDKQGRADSNATFKGSDSYAIAANEIDEIIEYLEKFSSISETIWLGPFVEARTSFKEKLNLRELKFNPNSVLAFNLLDQFISKRVGQKPRNFVFAPINKRLSLLGPDLVHGDCLIVRDVDHFSRCGEAIIGELIKDILVYQRTATDSKNSLEH